MIVELYSATNPKHIRTNLRYADIRHLPPLVRQAHKQLYDDAAAAGAAQGWKPTKNARLAVSFWFTMDDRRADLDGAEKRALDAVASGLGFNDQRVDELHLYRAPVGTPGIRAVVMTIGTVDAVDDTEEEPLDDLWDIRFGESAPRLRFSDEGGE